jgi:hypothetical protein
MIKLLTISSILYLVWVLLYLQRKRIKRFFYPKTNLPKIPPIYLNDDDVMGKTKMLLSQVATNDDSLRQIEKPVEIATTFAVYNEISRSARIDDSELECAFSDSPEPMDLDIEAEYSGAELLEQEDDLNCFEDDELTEPATGIRYDEMENLIQVIQQTGISQEAELIAVNTIQQMNQTELFQLMVSQIEGGKERVTEMLNKYNPADLITTPFFAETMNADFEKFEINNFL